MQNYAINNKLTPFISMQNHYNLVYREEEREMLPMLKVCIVVLPLYITRSDHHITSSTSASDASRGPLSPAAS